MSEEQLQGYCFKCKEKRPLENPVAEWAANGSPRTRGTCPVCGGSIYRVGRVAAHDTLEKPAVAQRPARAKNGVKAETPRSGKLVIVESPAKAKTIGRYLGKGYTVKSSLGHVRDLLKSRLSVDVEHNYAPEYRVPNEKRPLVKELKEAAAKAEEIYLATDPDREGEAIAWHVMEAAEMEPQRTKRVVFQEITKSAVQAAFARPREIDMQRVEAQQARRILDRLVGYNLSPLLWRKVHGRLSAGRVQSVAVRLVVEREREIEAFVAVEYWTIDAELSQFKHRLGGNGRGVSERPFFRAGLYRIDGKEPSLTSEAEVRPHLDALGRADWQVAAVKLGERTRKPAAPFTTSTLQQDASRRIGFGTSKTMRIAQQLYEGVDIGESGGSVGLITYMRTDSVNVAAEAQQQTREFIVSEYGAEYVPETPPVYKTRSKSAQEAHEAIRPTHIGRTPAAMKPYLTRDQQRLYQLIWERFVASQMSPAIYDTVTADIRAGEATIPVEQRPYWFRATGSTLRFRGFLIIYGNSEPDDEAADEPQSKVPSDLQPGEGLDLLRLLPEQHFTQPPPRYSEASLVKALEEYGIGRPSTYAAIISTIQQRRYVELENKRLRPTETGYIVNDLLVEHFPDVLSVDFTARLEDELDEIAGGKEWEPVIDDFYKQFSRRLEIADKVIPKVDIKREPEPVGRECPESGHPLVYREGRYGRFIGCSAYPQCRYTEQILVKVGVSCPTCGGDLIQKRTRRGRIFYGCSNYPTCNWSNWKRPLPQPCPVCGGVMVQENKDTAKCTVCEHTEPYVQPEAALEAQ